MTTWRSYFLDMMDLMAENAKKENAKMARDFLDKMNGDFHSHNRSAGQRRRWANYRRIHGQNV